MKLNNKGFTLIEVLAVIAIIAIIGGIAIPNVLSSINKSKNKSEEILIENIKTAAEEIYQVIDINGKQDSDGNIIVPERDESGNIIKDGTGKIQSALIDRDNSDIKINKTTKSVTVSIQGLVINGFLKGNGEEDLKRIINPKTREDIGDCIITIQKIVDDNYNTTYRLINNSTDQKCPTY